MADQPDNIVLQLLRRIDTRTERMAHDVHDIKLRMTAVEEAVVGVTRRIETRLDLVEPSH